MKSLHDLEQAFAVGLWGDDLHNMQGLIIDEDLSAARRFNVYRNNFQTSLTEALAAVYPVVEKLVGRDFFGFLADRYIRAHPSRSGNLHSMGCAMANFLSRFQPVSKLPYLADVARLEWAYHAVFHAKAPPSFDPNALKQVAAESYANLCFDIGSACRLVRSPYPIFRIWKLNQEDYIGDDEVNLGAGPESVLVVRPELEVELWRLNPAEFTFLSALKSGSNLGEAVATTLAHSQEFDLTASLARYLSSGALIVSRNQVLQPKKFSSRAKRQLKCSPVARPV